MMVQWGYQIFYLPVDDCSIFWGAHKVEPSRLIISSKISWNGPSESCVFSPVWEFNSSICGAIPLFSINMAMDGYRSNPDIAAVYLHGRSSKQRTHGSHGSRPIPTGTNTSTAKIGSIVPLKIFESKCLGENPSWLITFFQELLLV